MTQTKESLPMMSSPPPVAPEAIPLPVPTPGQGSVAVETSEWRMVSELEEATLKLKAMTSVAAQQCINRLSVETELAAIALASANKDLINFRKNLGAETAEDLKEMQGRYCIRVPKKEAAPEEGKTPEAKGEEKPPAEKPK